MEPTLGFEPRTCCLRNSCSTAELCRRRFTLTWSVYTDVPLAMEPTQRLNRGSSTDRIGAWTHDRTDHPSRHRTRSPARPPGPQSLLAPTPARREPLAEDPARL